MNSGSSRRGIKIVKLEDSVAGRLEHSTIQITSSTWCGGGGGGVGVDKLKNEG